MVAGCRKYVSRGFTLLEIMAAVVVLGFVIAFSSVIFKVSIEAHRAAGASAEIMQKLRAVTNQLNIDFQGLRTDTPLLIWFEQDTDSGDRYDQIMFFADGDFHSTQLYDGAGVGTHEPADTGARIQGNAARIHYGQAQVWDGGYVNPIDQIEGERVLARRQHILTADDTLVQWPDISAGTADFNDSFTDVNDGVNINETYEHDSLSLSQWKTLVSNNCEKAVMPVCFEWRPEIEFGDPNTYHKLMCEGMGSLKIQWAYWDDDPLVEAFRWFPSDDPDGDGDGDDSDSHFALNDSNDTAFGALFNVASGGFNNDYGPWEQLSLIKYKTGDNFAGFYPKALKFTFRLYDSAGIIEGGREFTHIVYIGE
ncbi:PilW family protein [Planctomycetota bacterium]